MIVIEIRIEMRDEAVWQAWYNGVVNWYAYESYSCFIAFSSPINLLSHLRPNHTPLL